MINYKKKFDTKINYKMRFTNLTSIQKEELSLYVSASKSSQNLN